MTLRALIVTCCLVLALMTGLGVAIALVAPDGGDGLSEPAHACAAVASLVRTQGLNGVTISPRLQGLPDRGYPFDAKDIAEGWRNRNFHRLREEAARHAGIEGALNCTAIFQAAGLELDPGPKVREGMARGPAGRSELVWFSRPLFLGRWMLVREGRVTCVRSGDQLGLDVNSGSEPCTILAKMTANGWRRTTPEGREYLLLFQNRPLNRCPEPEDAQMPARWRPSP